MSISLILLQHVVEVIQPPTSAVRKFLSLLEQSDIDFSEELGRKGSWCRRGRGGQGRVVQGWEGVEWGGEGAGGGVGKQNRYMSEQNVPG